MATGINNTLMMTNGLIKPNGQVSNLSSGLGFNPQTNASNNLTNGLITAPKVQNSVSTPSISPTIQSLTTKTNSLLGGNQFNTQTGAPIQSQPITTGDPNWQPQEGATRDFGGQTQFFSNGNWTTTNPNYGQSVQPATPQSSTPTFPGIVGGIVGQSSQATEAYNQAQGDAQKARQALMQSAPQQNADVLKQQQSIQQLQNDYANQKNLIAGNRTDLQESGGEQGLLGNLYASRLGAEQTGLSNILQGNAQQQAAFTGAGNLANTAGGIATGQQQTQIGGLGTAAGLVQPQLGQYGQYQYQPLQAGQGNQNNGGAINPLNNIQSIAQQVVSGQISPAQANALGGNVSNFQGALNQAILGLNPNYNAAQAQGAYDAKQSNVTTSGTAPTNAASSVYQDTYRQLLDLKNITSNVDQFGNLLLNTMKDVNGNIINPTDAKFANLPISQIKSQLSSEQQSTFDSTYAALKSRVSGLLAQGGSEIPTQITSDANKILDGSLPFHSLSAVLQRITTEGNILTSNLQNKLNTSAGVIGAPKSGNNDNPLGI